MVDWDLVRIDGEAESAGDDGISNFECLVSDEENEPDSSSEMARGRREGVPGISVGAPDAVE